VRIGAIRSRDLDRALKELSLQVLPAGPCVQDFLGPGGEIERARVDELQLDLRAESEFAARAEHQVVGILRPAGGSTLFENAYRPRPRFEHVMQSLPCERRRSIRRLRKETVCC
jgi:hypothetical protein